ncbi:hypothetical protein HG66A1_62050 [Gimesia chilikensis]|uniref:Uncharacterized protein n=1 Tax=Gimesia chilikensis TaxID=2605989 RepID=A0A517PYC0_9PLAN|nr:hypothetical protein HG66A1_62050 [Gimesia chilikensis]
MDDLADRCAAVGKNSDGILLCGLRNGRVSYTVMSHHAAHKQFGDVEFVEYLFQCRSLKTVGILLHDDGCIWSSGEDTRIDFDSGRLLAKEGGLFLLDDVLNVDDRDVIVLRPPDRFLDVLRDGLGVPQRELSISK